MEQIMVIGGLVKTTCLDYPGHLAAAVFAAGCPYSCFYCHNRSLISMEHRNEAYAVQEIYRFLEKRKGLLEGVVITGGEPSLQNSLKDFLIPVKKLGYKIKLDTNGSRPETIADLISSSLVDYLALDVKAPWDRYQEICGEHADCLAVQESLKILESSCIPWEVRTTVCPTLTQEDLLIISSAVPSAVRIWRWNLYRKPNLFLPEDAWRVDAASLQAAELLEFSKSLHTSFRIEIS